MQHQLCRSGRKGLIPSKKRKDQKIKNKVWYTNAFLITESHVQKLKWRTISWLEPARVVFKVLIYPSLYFLRHSHTTKPSLLP